MDFADEELHLEHLAVRFKLEETRDEFKKIFEQCQEELRKKGTPVKSDTPATSETEKVSFKFYSDCFWLAVNKCNPTSC